MADNYSFAIPLNQSQCLKVTFSILDNQTATNDQSSQQNAITIAGSTEKDSVELSDVNELPENIFQALKTAYAAYIERANLKHSFMVSTTTGFHLLRLQQIICFEYVTEKRQWIVLLTNQTSSHLKRNTTSENILNYSSNFVQINQHYIINLQYLNRIEGKLCQLSIPSIQNDKLIISRSYLKGLQERIEVI
jgi:DNA-binding LytR/AlgR family response regulator